MGWGLFPPPVGGADLRAALVASCLRGALQRRWGWRAEAAREAVEVRKRWGAGRQAARPGQGEREDAARCSAGAARYTASARSYSLATGGLACRLLGTGHFN
jgi:hypothetical protein